MKYYLLLVAWGISLTIFQAYSQDTVNGNETEQKIKNLVRTYLDSELKEKVPKLVSYSIDSIQITPFSEQKRIQHDALLIARSLQRLHTKMEKLEEQYAIEPSSQLSKEIDEIKAYGSEKIDEVNNLAELAQLADNIDTVCYTVTVLTNVEKSNGVKRASNLFFRVSKDYFIVLKPEEFMPEIYELFNY